MLNSRLERLTEFPFRRLAALLSGVAPGGEVRDLALGEPQHPPPQILADTVAANAHLWHRYPPTNGTPDYRAAVVGWLRRRYDLPDDALDPDRHVLPLAGTKEGLFGIMSVLVPNERRPMPSVITPSPLYATIYGGAVMAGAEPVCLPATRETGYLPDLDSLSDAELSRCAVFYLCSPANPQGSVAGAAYLARLIGLARQHGFVVLIDECYSEIYVEAAPPGGLAAAWQLDRCFDNVLVFNSLSKRSNAAGLRSGFVAGDPSVIRAYLRLRGYSAPVQPLPLMAAAVELWRDEAHVRESRERYRHKFDSAARRFGGRFGFYRPEGGFFLWLDVGDGVGIAAETWRQSGVKVLPGAFLATPDRQGRNPGASYIRVAMVHDEVAVDAALASLTEVLAGHPLALAEEAFCENGA